VRFVAFSPEYVRLVLGENFEDAKALFLSPLLAIHAAHLVMLKEQGIIPLADARALRDALTQLDPAAIAAVPYDDSREDLFFFCEGLIVAACGEDVAGRLHTARSRNDIDMTMYRMRLREYLLALTDATLGLRASLAEIASQHGDTLFAAHTHTQPAQATTLAHYLLGVIEQLERDSERLFAAYGRTNLNPLGACAITGTGFPIDRERTSELLGFDGPTGNTYGSIATVDYLLESVGAAATAVVGLGRVVQDFLLWCTVEVGYLRLAAGLVQASSIMPQKRNPVALEHARALASKALAQALGIPVVVHNTPFGDIVDTEDDLQPLVASAFKDATRAMALVAASLVGAKFDTERMLASARAGWITVTELADTLARDHGVPFRIAHAIAGHVVRSGNADIARSVHEAVATFGFGEVDMTPEEVECVLSPEHFVRVRRTWGGPAPEITAQALDTARVVLDADRAQLESLRARLTSADARRREAMRAI
jgi:argininosuccinate lyase